MAAWGNNNALQLLNTYNIRLPDALVYYWFAYRVQSVYGHLLCFFKLDITASGEPELQVPEVRTGGFGIRSFGFFHVVVCSVVCENLLRVQEGTSYGNSCACG